MPGILPVWMATVRTLIVDDHADVRFGIRAIVGDSGLPIEVVGEADDAVRERAAVPGRDRAARRYAIAASPATSTERPNSKRVSGSSSPIRASASAAVFGKRSAGSARK